MRIIDIPPEIEAKDVQVPQGRIASIKIKFIEWLQGALDADGELAKGIKNIRRAVKLADLLREANGTLALEDADYDLIKRAVDGHQLVAGLARQLLPYYEAVEKAQETSQTLIERAAPKQ